MYGQLESYAIFYYAGFHHLEGIVKVFSIFKNVLSMLSKDISESKKNNELVFRGDLKEILQNIEIKEGGLG